MNNRRLIEESFPLKEVSADSKHEKNVRHGHISTLHIWPARRPLAASRAAIIAALMPDPGDEAGRAELNKKIASITRWGTENGPALDTFRRETRQAYGGRAPRVLDMFAGGGAIPLEAMRLGCDVTAIDYNPVAWFILKCTLEFPQRLAGQTWPLPGDALPPTVDEWVGDEEGEGGDADVDAAELATPSDVTGRAIRETASTSYQPYLLREAGPEYKVEGNLADHVRYWGRWVLARAHEELAPYYPTVDGQPTVAYLWARTVPCPDPACGATVPLLKTLWLSKKAEKTLPDTSANRARPDFLHVKTTKNTSRVVINGRRALRLVPPPKGQGGAVRCEIWTPGPKDEVGEGTMAGSQTSCPSCGANIAGDFIKECGHTGRLGAQATAVVVDAGWGKEYRPATPEELKANTAAAEALPTAAERIPYGLPTEPLPGKERHRAVGSQLPHYAFKNWADLFTGRQSLTLVTLVRISREAHSLMEELGFPVDFVEAVSAYLAIVLDRLADRGGSSLSHWDIGAEGVVSTFSRFALAMNWDFAEAQSLSSGGGGYLSQLDWVLRYIDHAVAAMVQAPLPTILQGSSTIQRFSQAFDAIVTDPPYYDSIPYSDISDFYYVWLRRSIGDRYPTVFAKTLTPKEQELVQQARTGETGRKGKDRYETGMSTAFQCANSALVDNGQLVIVFAHKEPDAWETLAAAIIQAGFTVVASWPIDTEMQGGMRSKVASLSSSIWLVCRKRPAGAGTGRYKAVRRAMEARVTERLHYFWDMGLSGPDFVWAAVGPALESYSAYDEVRRLNGTLFTVGEFLKEARRLVADFSLGRILHGQSTEGLDEWTRYYLIHRASFGLDDAPVGECILLSQGYGLDLNELRGDRGYVRAAAGSAVRLAKWDERLRPDLGQPHPKGGLPHIDALHRLIVLWAAGNTADLSAYAADHGLRGNDLFWAVAQAVLEMGAPGSRERSLLEAVVAWGRGRGSGGVALQPALIDPAD